MSEAKEPIPQVDPEDSDAVLALQETPSEESEVEGHMVALSTLSASSIVSC